MGFLNVRSSIVLRFALNLLTEKEYKNIGGGSVTTFASLATCWEVWQGGQWVRRARFDSITTLAMIILQSEVARDI